ncbi:phosphatase PAP2 family protein [Actinotalea sp. M2MS4P-6]|uniref:phosphatase PAP2 family protein n=1 Tax=Actinotalea sp. M2MS4P-6 TaxID=2983762 RepID=UPI0021E4A43E|nr:phosphatase PAP2 family protein [Actinotalea sp. M2MS4P-6]MCV2394290.1 phosphatase PAP2 family protein [Actinotalea sp. M2MS4P-6]
MTSTPDAALARPDVSPVRSDTRRPRAILWWALGLTAAFVAMGLAVAVDPGHPFTQGIDDAWRALVGVSPESAAYTGPLPMFFQALGEAPGALFMVVLLPAGLAIVGRWRSALFFVAACMAGMGVYSQVMKNLVDRPRPAADGALGLFGPLFDVDHGSFPSGHAVSAGVLVIGVLALIPAAHRTARTLWGVLGGLIVLGMIWQRTLINAHWLSDAVFGAVAGAAAALLMTWAFWPWLREDHGRPVRFRRTGTA